MLTLTLKQNGFSLLEILVAFSILSMVLGVVYQIFSRSSQHIVLANEYAKASIIAQSKLATIGVDIPFLSNDKKGIIEKKYHWSVSIRPFTEYEKSDFSIGSQLYEANAHVTWNSLGKKRKLDINTLKLIAND